MTSVHSIFSWLKRKDKTSKKPRVDRTITDAGDGVFATDGLISGSAKCRRSVANIDHDDICRQSLMLPPIPRDQLFSHLPDRLWTDSPSHVYEEIPISTFELESSVDTTSGVSLNHLDLSNAKEVGPYLVVPLKDALSGRVIVTSASTQKPDSQCPKGPVHKHLQRRKSLPSSPLTIPVEQPNCDINLDSLDTLDCLTSEGSQPKVSPAHSGTSMSPGNTYLKEEELVVLARGSSERIRLDRQRRNSDSGGHATRHVNFRDSTCRARLLRTSSRTNSIVSSDSGNSSSHSITLSDTTLPPYSDDTTDSYNSSSVSCTGSLEMPKSLQYLPPRHSSGCVPRATEVPESNCTVLGIHIPTGPLPACSEHMNRVIKTPMMSETFSEYDIRTDEAPSSHSSPGSPHAPCEDEYEYFLGKVRKNFALKETVHKLILSESSDYEACSSVTSTYDSSPLTPVTSDDCSALVGHIRHCQPTSGNGVSMNQAVQNVLKTSCKNKPQTVRQTKHKSRNLSGKKSCSTRASKITTRPPNVSGLHSNGEVAEFYCLPDFRTSQSTSDIALSTHSPVIEMDTVDKFSCRVTKLRPEDIQRQLINTPSGDSTSRSGETFAGCANKSSTLSSGGPFNRTTRPNTQNRVLSDLMRMNHDRLTVLF